MERVIRILMRRDGITREEAEEEIRLFQETAEACLEEGDMEGVTEALYDILGLEEDYIFDILQY